MRIHRRRFAAAGAAAAAAALALTACGAASAGTGAGSASAASGKHITIGFSPMNQSAPALIGLTKGIQGYAGSKGDKVMVADPKNDAAAQVQQVTAWIENKQVDAVWILALNPSSMKPVLEKAKQKGVAVLALGVPGDYGYQSPEAGISFSTIDYTAYGTDLGNALGKCVNDKLGGKGQVLFLQDPAGAVGSPEAEKAFRDALAKTAPDASVVATANNQLDRLKSQQATLSALQANSGINVIAGQNDEAALGAVGAVKQSGKNPADMCIGDTGGNDEVLKDVQSGDMYTSIALQFEADTKQNVDKLDSMAADPSTVGQQLTVPIKTVTKQ